MERHPHTPTRKAHVTDLLLPRQSPRLPIPAIGYIRVSTAREEMISPDIQRATIDRHAEATGREIVEWIEDLDETGRNFNRDIQRGIHSIEAGDAREILVYRYDRWGRHALHSLMNIARVEAKGGQVVSATEPVDTKTAMGRQHRHQIFGWAQFQSDLIGENWKSAHAHRIARGLPAGGGHRWGYDRLGRVRDPFTTNRWVPDPTDPLGERYVPNRWGEVLGEMYVRYASGASFYRICEWAHGVGARTTSGRPFRETTLTSILDSGFGAGMLWVHDPECPGHADGAKCMNRIYVPGAQPAVVPDPSVWDDYLDRRTTAKKTPPRSREVVHELSGVIKCGHCGGRMSAHRDRRYGGDAGRVGWRCSEYHYGRCAAPRSVGGPVVMREVLRVLAADADDIEGAAGEHTVGTQQRQTDRLGEIDAELAALKVKQDRLTKRYAEDDIPKDSYTRVRDEYLARQGELTRERAELAKPQEMEPIDYVPVIRGLLAEWGTLPVPQRNHALKRFLAVEAFRESRTEAWIVIRTSYGAEHRADVAEKPGRKKRENVS
jgi:DNA invertase Pin-like site-specific DNA recombinase